MQKLYDTDSWIFILGITTIYLLILFFVRDLFITDDIYYRTFKNIYSAERIEEIIRISGKWDWFNYISAILFMILRICYTSLCLLTGIYFLNIRVPYSSILNVSVKAEAAFLIEAILTFINQIFILDISTLKDLSYTPFSLLNILNRDSLNRLFIYPLSFMNIFEFAYWLILGGLMAIVLERSFLQSFRFVAISYGSGLLLYLLLTTFIILSFT